jgi:hypothetical protein
MTFQDMVESIASLAPKAIEQLSIEDQDQLFELVRRRRIEQRRSEIFANAQRVFRAGEQGTAKRGDFADLKSYLLEDDEE